jgi:FemAB-related protein (PEP-CTERM system-associated)
MQGRESCLSRTPPVRVAPYAAEERHDWNEFVRRSRCGTFFHLIEWKDVLEKCFGYRPRYLTARRGRELAGVLPLFELTRPLGGTCLLSLPFAVEGGVCADNDEARRALEAAAVDLGVACGARYLELRDGLEGGEGFRPRPGPYFRFRRALAGSDEDNLRAIPRKQRRMIRVGERAGLQARTGDEHLEAFHDLYARSVRRLGTPVFARAYFRTLCERFGDACVLLTVYREQTPAAAVLSFFFKDTVIPYYAGSRRELGEYAVNDFLYWQLMCLAQRRGARAFDFGRSKEGTGAFDFKRHWGFEPEPMRYRVHACGREGAPERSLGDWPVLWLRRGWRRLPLRLTKLLGPPLVQRFGPHYT